MARNKRPINQAEEFSRDNAAHYVSIRKSRKRKHAVNTVLASLLIVVIALGGAAFSYYQVLQNRMSGGSEVHNALENVLTERIVPEDPYYVLLLGTDGRTGETMYRSDTMVLTRVDPEDKTVTMLSIPRDTMVTIDGYGTQKINAAHAFGGPEGAVEAVENLTGVEINHYLEVGFEGFGDIVDAIGGVEVDVPCEINDWKAGDEIIEPGLQTLNGAQALTFCRSREFVDGDYTRMEHQRLFIAALGDQLLNDSSLVEMTQAIDAASNNVLTDMSITEMVSMATELRGLDMNDVNMAYVPSAPEMVGGISYVIADQDALDAMMTRINAGLSPESEDVDSTESIASTAVDATNITPSDYTVTVWNGTNTSGLSQTIMDESTAQGFVDAGTDVADTIYTTSKVCYTYSKNAEAAQELADQLGISMVEQSDKTFEGNILVIVGEDLA